MLTKEEMNEVIDRALGVGEETPNFDKMFKEIDIDVEAMFEVAKDVYESWIASIIRPDSHNVGNGMAAAVIGQAELATLTTGAILVGMMIEKAEREQRDAAVEEG